MTFSAEEALLHARKLADRGETGKARYLYQLILERHPERGEARDAILSLERRSAQLNNLSAMLEKGAYDAMVEQGEPLAAQFPDSVVLHNLLGVAYANLGRPETAIPHLAKALSVRPDMAELHANLGKALGSVGEKEGAVASFLEAVKLRPDHADAHFSLGMVLSSLSRHEQAADSFFRALKLRPDLADAEIHLGNALRELGRLDDAMNCFHRALALAPDEAEAHIGLATIHNQQRRFAEAIASLDAALKIAPERDDARALKLFLATTLCDWDMLEQDRAAIPALGVTGKAVQPFMLLALDDDPARSCKRAEQLARDRYALPGLGPMERPASRPARLKLGYFSADFHEHAVLFQLIRVLELHDRGGFEVYAYSYGPPADDPMRARARKAADVFRDVRDLNGKEIAQLARRDGIDIAIDLMGYTRNGRTEIFAYRAAPVQIAYLGYPGSLGASFMDYMIADRVIVPEEQRPHYVERILFLPHAHMATDNTKRAAENSVTRRELNLPEAGFVFCCFNNSYKISPAMFDIWMRLLRQVEGSVLWLAGTNGEARHNLAEEARKRGVDPLRLVFTGRVAMADHLARHRLADLFLDTFQYSGHSTAADALWMGLPVLTLPGRGFPTRVAASLLSAIGLPELVAETAQDYERVALELAQNPDRLAAHKQRLAENRTRMPLFDTEGFTKNLEDGYRQAHERFRAGQAPADIAVSGGKRD